MMITAEQIEKQFASSNGDGNSEASLVVEPEPAVEEKAKAFPEIAWHGLFARWRDIVAPCTEAPLENLWTAFLLAAGMIIGRNIWREMPRPLYPNFYVLLVGETGDSRKSTVMWLACELLRRVGEDFVELPGVVSSEGIYEALSQREETKALISADEFRAFLSVSKRKGTQDILPRLNTIYYCPERDSINRVKDSTTVIRPFVSLLAATPRSYVDDMLGELEVGGGFLNRLLIVSGSEQAPRPMPRQPTANAWASIASPLKTIQDQVERSPRHIEFAPEAFEEWVEFYTKWKNERRGWNSKQLQLTARIHEHVLKIAMVYSTLAGESQIGVESLSRAIAIGGWLQSNTLTLFSDTGLDQLAKVERVIVAVVKPKKGPMFRRDLQQMVSKRGYNAELFNRALISLEKNDVVIFGKVTSPAGRERPTVQFLDGNTGTGNR